ncbi:6-phospho-beta-glucosidase [Flavobacterium hiemivividum]|uniref:6-phospho-beta-glucosidase n=1 Tax=Flavobacterium hiemivividum TaxID=2541734 RepID=A0A4R5D0M5_9FLAO|nr:6-phospho-beta-glucosidase [Flavobacterium hiemivividum]TDE06749.1 6-phospho-beta-glucosidase [Flavobacterium hiemivividum]
MVIWENNDYSYWTFIEKYYPKYYSCSDILLSDILNRKLNGEHVCEEDEEMIKDWNVKAELKELNKVIFSKSLKNYLIIKTSL